MEFSIKKTNKEISQRQLEGYERYSELIQWGRKNPVMFCEYMLGIEFMDFQRYIFMNSWDKTFCLWVMSRNAGKALALDTPINTPTGWSTMKELEVGDYVFGDNGKPTKIIATSPIFYNHDCYLIKFNDGEEIVADKNHIWYVLTRHGGYKTLTTEELVDKGYYSNTIKKGKEYREFKYRVPMGSPIDYEKKQFEIEPYSLGVWLGDGNERDARVTSHIGDYEELKSFIEKDGYAVSVHDRKGRNVKALGIGVEGKGDNKFLKGLKKYNLIENKHIPEIYFYGSVEQRLELLQGLMDTDGTCSNRTDRKVQGCEFGQKDKKFMMQFVRLLDSLNIKHSKLREKITKLNDKKFISYRISFWTDKDLPCFKLNRKLNRLSEKLSRSSSHKTIVEITKVNSVPTKCIMVDNESHLYLCGKHNTVTHNSTLVAPFNMTKLLLFPNFTSYILSITAAQSSDTFTKMEKIAKKQIESFTGLTDFYLGEVVPSANSDGFTHSPAGFKFSLYNGSQTTSLAGIEDNVRGK